MSQISAGILIDDLPIAAFMCASDGTILAANNEMQRQFDCRQKSTLPGILNARSSYVFHSQVLPTLRSAGTISEVALDILSPDGAFVPVLANFRLVADPPQAPRIIGCFLVSEQRRQLETRLIAMRKQVEASEVHFRQIAESVQDVIIEVDDDARLLYVSPASTHVLGYNPSDIIGSSLRNLVHPDDIVKYIDTLNRAADREISESRVVEIRFRHRDGAWKWLQSHSAQPQFDQPTGKQVCAIDCLRDIDAEKLAALELRSSQEFFETVARLSGVGGWELNFLDNRLSWTPSAAAVFGVEPTWDPVDLDHLISRFFEAQAGGSFKEAIENILFSRAEALIELPILHCDGEVHWVEIFAHPRLDDSGEVVGVFGAVRDISDRIRTAAILAEAALEAAQASETKSRFLANMSHEIRTPLNGVLGVAAALARTELNPRQLKMVQLITDSGRTLSGLLNDILDLSKMEAGEVALEPSAVCLSELILGVAALFEPTASAKGLELLCDVSIDPNVQIIADPIRLKQILNNLVGNALKFTKSGSVILKAGITMSSASLCELMICVVDTGIGFDAEVRERLFGRFVQADSSTNRTFGGSGLGLSICRTLADMMDGEVNCQSEPGVGSTFWFKAQFTCTAKDAQAAESSSVEVVLPRGCAVLAVDDSEVNRSVLRMLLEDHVSVLDFAENGAEAVDASRQKRYDVILMDTQMPVMDGLEATCHIRRHAEESGIARTPIITLSANVMADQVAEARAAGADDYVAKPIDRTCLFEAIARCTTPVPANQQSTKVPDGNPERASSAQRRASIR